MDQYGIWSEFNIVRLWRLTGGYLKQVLELLACRPGGRHVLCYFQAQTFEGPELWQACGAEIHARHRLCKISRHQKQGYVWFLPWWHVLIWPIKNFAFSFFYIKPATVSSRAFVLCRMAQNILGQKLKRFQLKSSNPFVYARPVPLRKYQHPVLPPGNGPMVREGLLCELTFKWYVTESDLCLPGFTPCGCEEEHPPLHQRRCLDLVLTSYNCQSLFHRAFQVLSSHLPFSSTGVRAAPGMDSPLGFSRRITDVITRCQAEDVEATKAVEAKKRAILSGLLSFETGTNLYTEAYGLPSLRASAQGHQQRGGQEIPGTFAAAIAVKQKAHGWSDHVAKRKEGLNLIGLPRCC